MAEGWELEVNRKRAFKAAVQPNAGKKRDSAEWRSKMVRNLGLEEERNNAQDSVSKTRKASFCLPVRAFRRVQRGDRKRTRGNANDTDEAAG